ncbi:hypothetical protein [Alcanivorax sediminis]|uniref:Uncharacterized protein n=1 Tax=Alcanivorax sediminis TaxID=2663008 RepID=A0A6N7LXB1_9GAMM|nr:hypothetical protein [Alcanivorax sediminis]MQX54026.1 hypothetical protein [Alcanivorax sediminis]
MRRVSLRIFLWLWLCTTQQIHAAESATLSAIRADLQTGSLNALLKRQAVVGVPTFILEKWLIDTRFQSFAVTGFNENPERFAVRLRLHFSAYEANEVSPVAFIRVAGRSGKRYTVDQFHDYTTGLDLVALESQQEWLTSADGKEFLSTLSNTPEADVLSGLAQGRSPVLALWLAQCAGQPCETIALAAQREGPEPAVWQLQRAFSEGDKYQALASLDAMRAALGEDPWLWQLAGVYARAHGHCVWVASAMQAQWAKNPESRVLADTSLQCTLASMGEADPALDKEGTAFLNRLSDQIGPGNLSQAIIAYHEQHDRPIPDALARWMATTRGE